MQVPQKTTLGKALGYSLNQWHKLVRYVDDSNLAIDNNRTERAIKPFVIGRKNWLFSNATSGANASAILYSIIETAKANGLTHSITSCIALNICQHCQTMLKTCCPGMLNQARCRSADVYDYSTTII